MIKFLVTGLTVLTLFSGCSTAGIFSKNLPASPEGEWKHISTTNSVSHSKANILLHDGKISGDDGCNRFLGHYRTAGDVIEIDPKMMATMIICSADVMKNADEFKNSLLKTRFYRLDRDNKLILTDEKRAPLLEFSPFSNQIDPGEYRVLYYNNNRGGMISPLSGALIDVQMNSEGQFSGNGGCNNYTTSYALHGNNIAIGVPASTRKRCDDTLMEQEGIFLGLLPKTARWNRNGNWIELRDEKNTLMMILIKK